jgi:hypothetical protein
VFTVESESATNAAALGCVKITFTPRKPRAGLLTGHLFHHPIKRIFTAQAALFHAQDHRQGLIVLHASGVGEASSAQQAIEHECLHHNAHRRRIRAAAFKRESPGQIGDHSELLKVLTPCRRTTLGRESVSSDRHRHCASRTLKPEPLLSFTLRVKADYCR